MERLNKKLHKIHNYIYANEGLSNAETLNEFLKIFYCKILDEEKGNQLYKLSNEKEIIKYLHDLYSELKKRLGKLMDKKEVIELNSETLIYIVNELRDIELSSYSSDIKGHILQRIIDRSYRESRGQFFTPPQVVDFVVKMIAPLKGEKGCDPASGTGGFMFSALEYIDKNEPNDSVDLDNIFFYDISKSLIKLIAMRMMFEFSGDIHNYYVKNSITDSFNQKFDYVLTNPPFGTQGKIIDKNILVKYELGCDENGKPIKSQVPDILFVEKVIQILGKNGRAAIVLPDGDFENPSLEYFRKFLIENVKIEAVVSLPDGTFIPYGTGVKSSVLFLRKTDKKELAKEIKNNYPVFYGKITKLGYTFSKHSKDEWKEDGSLMEDYNEIVNAYKNKEYSDKAYLVNVNSIIQNKYMLSESFYSPEYTRVIDTIKSGTFAPLKDLVTFKYQKEKIDAQKEYKYIEIADVNAYTSEIINSTDMLGEDLPSRASYLLKEGDILVATSGNSIGTQKQAKAIVTDQYGDCICTNGFTVFRATKISAYYLLRFFNSDEFLKQMLKYKYGTAIPCVGREDFEKILVPIPEEQELVRIENNIKRAIELRNEAMRLMSE
ncbi:MAG: N-6 DNA methylase [Lachnospiraceae bacterium]|nr:N-6 DNA methylase [Lachnospiraceae bacterium]